MHQHVHDLDESDRTRQAEAVRDGLAAARRIGRPCDAPHCTERSVSATSQRGVYRTFCRFHATEIELDRWVARQHAERRAMRARR